MKEIKFRSAHYDYDNNFKYFTFWGRLNFKDECDLRDFKGLSKSNNTIIKADDQYVGLKDKAGKEIFEDDLVRILYTDWPSQTMEKNGRYSMSLEQYKVSISKYGKVAWNNKLAGFELLINEEYYGSIDPGKHGEIEVVGNIYENQDLLNKT